MNNDSPMNNEVNGSGPSIDQAEYKKIISVILLLIIIGVTTYFIFFKQIERAPNYKVNNIPNTQSTTTSVFNSDIFSLEEIENAQLDLDYINDIKVRPLFSSDRRFNTAQLTNGFATFEYCIDGDTCEYDKNGYTLSKNPKTAKVYLESLNIPVDKNLLDLEGYYNFDNKAVGVMKFEIEGKIYSYLTVLRGSREMGPVVVGSTFLSRIENGVTKIDVEKGPILKVYYGDSIYKLYTFESIYRGDVSLIQLTNDRLYKIFEDGRYNVSFKYTIDAGAYFPYRYDFNRAWGAEQYNAVKPIYYSSSCELERDFPEFAISLMKRDPTNSDGMYKQTYRMDLTVSSEDFDTLYLTTPVFGYSPEDWNKITSIIKYRDYLNLIKNGKTLSGVKASPVVIAGKKINFIPEKKLPRPCDNQSRDQYIWAEGDRVVTLRVKNYELSKEEMNKVISGIISSINVR